MIEVCSGSGNMARSRGEAPSIGKSTKLSRLLSQRDSRSTDSPRSPNPTSSLFSSTRCATAPVLLCRCFSYRCRTMTNRTGNATRGSRPQMQSSSSKRHTTQIDIVFVLPCPRTSVRCSSLVPSSELFNTTLPADTPLDSWSNVRVSREENINQYQTCSKDPERILRRSRDEH
jgi:hypothetical protein